MRNCFTLLLSFIITLTFGQLKPTWEATGASLVAKSTMVLVEYADKSDNGTAVKKYKLFDVAFGKVLLETNGRVSYAYGNRFLIIDDSYVNVYDIVADKVSSIGKIQVSELSKNGYKDLEVIGFSKTKYPMFKIIGSATPTYYIYNLTSRSSRKMAPPADFHKCTFMPQTGDFVYLTQAAGKHICYRYNPESESTTQNGSLTGLPDEKIYRLQLSPDNKYAIYGGCYVYDVANSKMLYQLPVNNQDINWTGDKMAYSGQKVTAAFSAKGDSIIIVKRLKENVASTEKVQIEIYDTITDNSVKSFFFNYKGDVMVDTDITSGWAAFVREGKVKVVHLTTKKVLREFSLVTPEMMDLYNTTGATDGTVYDNPNVLKLVVDCD